MPVRQLPSLQLVVLDFCAPEEANWEALRLACENNPRVKACIGQSEGCVQDGGASSQKRGMTPNSVEEPKTTPWVK